jgi:hypothetical protein
VIAAATVSSERTNAFALKASDQLIEAVITCKKDLSADTNAEIVLTT